MSLRDPESDILSLLRRLNEDQTKLRQLYEFIDEWQRLHIDTLDRDARQLIKDTTGVDLYHCINEVRVKLNDAIHKGKTNLGFLDGDIQRLQKLIRLSQNEDILLAAYNWQLDIQDAHDTLDSLEVPRTNSQGLTYTIAGRIWTFHEQVAKHHKQPELKNPSFKQELPD